MTIRLAIQNYPFNYFFNDGPRVFLNRLSQAFKKNNMFEVKSHFFPNHDAGLYTMKSDFFGKPSFLRVDGLHINRFKTKVAIKENKKVFESFQKSKGIIFQTKYCEKIFQTLYPNYTNKPSTIIHNGVPLTEFRPDGENYRTHLGISKKDKVLICSAHWRRHKRLKETIKLVSLLNNSSKKSNYKLIILGDAYDLKKIYFENKDLYFVGLHKPNNLSKWYRTADIFINLAWIEPSGNVQQEAIACGLPVICCNNGGIGETIKSASAGIISQTDEEYKFNYIDYYNPPEPNYSNLIKDIKNLFNNIKYFKDKIDYNEVDINIIAKRYMKFIKDNLS